MQGYKCVSAQICMDVSVRRRNNASVCVFKCAKMRECKRAETRVRKYV